MQIFLSFFVHRKVLFKIRGKKSVRCSRNISPLATKDRRFFGNISQNVFRKTRLYWLNLSSSLAMDVLHQDKSNILLKQVLDYIVTKGHMYHEFFALVYSCIFSTI